MLQQSAKKEDLFVVLVHYNSDGQINDCLRSIFAARPQLPPEKVIVVDNLSTDGSLEGCRQKYRKLTYIYNTQNIGFAAAANIGARCALERGATHVLFCNPDATLSEGCINTLVQAAQEQPGIFSPTIMHAKMHTVWFAGGTIDYIKQRAVHLVPDTQQQKPYETGYISGCVMCVSAEVFATVGLFDEQFFLYYEDVDFSVRTQKAGFVTRVVPQALAYHTEQSERLGDQKIYFLVLAGLQFFAKQTPLHLRLWYIVYTTVRRLVSLYKHLLRKPHAEAVRWAFHDYGSAKKSSHFISHRHL